MASQRIIQMLEWHEIHQEESGIISGKDKSPRKAKLFINEKMSHEADS
jgi:hypothetical protein